MTNQHIFWHNLKLKLYVCKTNRKCLESITYLISTSMYLPSVDLLLFFFFIPLGLLVHSPRLVLDLHPCMLKHCPVSRHHPPHLCSSWWSLCPMGYGDQLPLQYCFFFLGPNGPYAPLPLLSWRLCIILLLLIFTCKELTIQDLDVGQNVIIGSWEKTYDYGI